MTAEASSSQSSPSWQMTHLIWGVMTVQAICVAAELGIADLTSSGPMSVEDLAKTTKTHAPTLRRLLRALASIGVFAEDANGSFSNTRLSETLRGDHPESVRAHAMMWGTRFFRRPWEELRASIATGQPAFDRVFQAPFFEYLEHHEEDASIFDAAMTGGSSMDLSAVLAAYDFSQFERIVDVGGGRGALLHGILGATPGSRGVLYDLPAVVAGASALRTGPVATRCEILAGSFFDTIPAGADAYILKRIIHDWDDEAALRILKNCRRATKPGGTLLVIERVLKPPNQPDFGKFMDLHMLILLGGRERTAYEFQTLLREAGFSLSRVISTVGPHSILESMPL
jgi:hypothetical protein